MNFEKQNIYFLDSSLVGLLPLFKSNEFSKTAILVDENTYKNCYPIFGVLPVHHVIKIKSGEEQKNLKTATKIWQKLTDFEFDRKGLCINLGGGVIGDMGGFCAATYKRGINFIQIPTTLLSMVDASVGGKLGIDFHQYKNHIGVFQEPAGVYIYPGFLKTLDRRELRSGYAEIIKHCLIKDAAQWNNIRKITIENINDHHYDWSGLIRHSIEIKAQVVKEDPKEKGLRKILNFGHTLGHAIESFYLENPSRKLLHGEAIAVGIVCESYLSYLKKNVSLEDVETIARYINTIFQPVAIPDAEFESIINLTVQDKKNSHGKVKFSLLKKIGDCGYDYEATNEEIKKSFGFFNASL